MKSFPHILLHADTLGSTPDAAIIGLGAIAFDMREEGDPLKDSTTFYNAVLAGSNAAHERRVDPAAIDWWTTDAQYHTFAHPQLALEKAASNLHMWVAAHSDDHTRFWFWRALPDAAVFAHVFDSLHRSEPWGTRHISEGKTLADVAYMRNFEHEAPTPFRDSAHKQLVARADMIRECYHDLVVVSAPAVLVGVEA